MIKSSIYTNAYVLCCTQDMGGVGSFLRQNRTIYVGRIHVTDDVEEIVARHFAEWGQVERIRVLNSRGVAFITYTNEANAQFAKEAVRLFSGFSSFPSYEC